MCALTVYPRLPGNTTAHPEIKVETQRRVAQHVGADRAAYLFGEAQIQTVAVRTLSAVIEETGVPSIDLLKIDTEGDELAVLQGIADAHYPRIRQIALEAHEGAAQAEIERFLTAKGFAVSAEVGVAHGGVVRATRACED